MANPLEFFDLFGARHIEPSITGLIELETEEAVNPTLVNQLVIMGPFRGGEPKRLRLFNTISALRTVHDPDNVGDLGVALAAMARAPFADPDVFGAQQIATVRTDKATPGVYVLKTGTTPIGAVRTADYGVQNNSARLAIQHVASGAVRLTVQTPSGRQYSADLGLALQVQYVGTAGGSKTVEVVPSNASVTYGAQPADADTLTVNGVTFEFDNNSTVGAGAVRVEIGSSLAATMGNLAAAINAAGIGVTATATPTGVMLSGPQSGVVVASTGTAPTIVRSGKAARVRLAVGGTVVADFSLSQPAYNTVGGLMRAVQSVSGWEATLPSSEARFLDSRTLDFTSAPLSAAPSAAVLTAYLGAIRAWLTSSTQGQFTVDVGADVGAFNATDNTDLSYGFKPDVTAGSFSGASTVAGTITDWRDALDVVAAQFERGAILLVNSEDASVITEVASWVEEQRTLGRWFRAYFGAQAGVSQSQVEALVAQIDSPRCRVAVQRLGVVKGSSIEYLPPVFAAAILAGGASGNRPWVKPLTDKRVRVVSIHPGDNYTVETREALIEAGVTVFRQDEDGVKVALHVTASRDPIRRMPRIASEVDTVDHIDSEMRAAFGRLRGTWAGGNIAAAVFSIGSQVLQQFADAGALIPGRDVSGQRVPPWQWLDPAFTVSAGVLKMDYAVRIGGEINHISQHGRANYARIVATAGGPTTLSTTVTL
jgi:hypothetical protein